MIRFRFVEHPGIFTIATRIAQYGFWATHAEIVLPNGDYLSAMYKDGVQIRKPNYDNNQFIKEEFLNTYATAEQELKFYNFLESQINKPYDVWAVAAFIFADWFSYCREWEANDSWFCSEYLAAGCAVAGLFPDQFIRRASHVSVRDLYIMVTSRVEVK